jgi:hypothetical protein
MPWRHTSPTDQPPQCLADALRATLSLTARKLIFAGVAGALCAGHLGWSMTGTSFISSVADLPSSLIVSPPFGTGATQQRPEGAMGG